jgi:hypothetical protein
MQGRNATVVPEAVPGMDLERATKENSEAREDMGKIVWSAG